MLRIPLPEYDGFALRLSKPGTQGSGASETLNLEPQGSGATEPLTFNIQLLTASERSERATALGGTGGGNNQQVISIDWGFVLEWWYE